MANFSSSDGKLSGRKNGDYSDRRVLQDIVSNSTNSSSVGLDTVGIRVEEFDVESGSDFKIFETAEYSTGETSDVPLWRKPSGDPVEGKKAILSTGLTLVTVGSIDYMKVQSSLPKVLSGHNNIPVSTPEDISLALNKLEFHLEEQGIHCTLKDCPVDRVDICRNVRTDAPISDFEELLRDLQAPYLSARDSGYAGMKWDSKQSGYSSEREITFYDKSSEAGLEIPNIQRLEYRLQRRRVVKSRVGELSTTDLCQDLAWMHDTFRDIVEDLFPEPPARPEESGPEDLDSQVSCPPNEVEEHAQSAPQITTSDLQTLLAAIRSEEGSGCHALSRLNWALLWLLHPKPQRLWEALKRAADSEDGPSGGKYAVRNKVQEARSYARMVDEGLKTEDERLERLKRKLLF